MLRTYMRALWYVVVAAYRKARQSVEDDNAELARADAMRDMRAEDAN